MEVNNLQYRAQRVVALAIIFAVLFQLYLMSTAILNPNQVHKKGWLNEVHNEQVLLCTADGFQWVDINTLISVNSGTASDLIKDLNLHDGFQLKCSLLQSLQFFLLTAIGLDIATLLWLRRVKNVVTPYRFTECGRLVYRYIAPKQSPPCIFPA